MRLNFKSLTPVIIYSALIAALAAAQGTSIQNFSSGFSGGTVANATTFSSGVTFSGSVDANGQTNLTGTNGTKVYQNTTHSGNNWISLTHNGTEALITTGTGTDTTAANVGILGSLDILNFGSTNHRILITTGANPAIVMQSTGQIGFSSGDPSVSAADTQMARGGTNGAVRIFGGTVPTISSGFGTSPSVTAGGSNSLFQVNVGGGGAATSGVVAFNGSWTNIPYCFVQDQTSQAITTTAVPTISQVTITASAAWTASSLLNVFCVSQ